MNYEWDINKAITNFQKHGIHFADCVTVFEDNAAITVMDDCAVEERYITIGLDSLASIVVVIYTWREDTIRIISARKATPSEIQMYQKGETI